MVSKESLGFSMTRLFTTLYLGILGSIMLFLFIGQLITTKVLTDVESIIEADNFLAEIELLNEIAPSLSATQISEKLSRIADLNQVTIIPLEPSAIPQSVVKQLTNSTIAFDTDMAFYFKVLSPTKYYTAYENDMHPLIVKLDDSSLFLMLLLFLFVAVVCFLWLFGLRKKLKLIENTLEQISNGDLSARAPVHNGMEVGNINGKVNALAERIAQLLNSHKKLTNTIAHEFRSPLFRIQMQVALIAEAQSGESTKYVEGIEEDILSLQELIDELLQYAKFDQAAYQLRKSKFDVLALISSMIDKRLKNRVTNIELLTHGLSEVDLIADKKLIRRCLANLLNNAIKFAENQIVVSLVLQDSSILLTIEDDGQGVNDDEAEKIFEPFYRSDPKNQNGYGLGLAICNEVAKLHEGEISLSRGQLGGAKFSLTLPI